MQADALDSILKWLDLALTPPWLYVVYALPTALLVTVALLARRRRLHTPDPAALAQSDELLRQLAAETAGDTQRPARTPHGHARVLATRRPAAPAPKPNPPARSRPRPSRPDRHHAALAPRFPASRSGDDDDLAALDAAEAHSRKTLAAIDPDQSPRDWAMAVCGLAMVIYQRASDTDDDSGLAKLMEANTALEKAVRLCPRDTWPEDWAVIQSIHGDILFALALRLRGDTTHMFVAAEAAYRNALEIISPKTDPVEWATIQYNLGLMTYMFSAGFDGRVDVQKLTESEDAFRNALTVFTLSAAPGNFAMIQLRLAAILEELAGLTGDRAKLLQAEQAYREALRVYSLKHHARTWAEIQRSLADILHHLGNATPGPEGVKVLRQAAEACRQALKAPVGENQRIVRGFTSLTLAAVLLDLGKRVDGQDGLKELREAEKAGAAALEVIAEDTNPQRWNVLQRLMAMIKLEQSRRLRGDDAIQALRTAERHCLRAISGVGRATQPAAAMWAWSQTALGLVLYEFGMRLGGREGLQKLQMAEQAYLRALEVWTADSFPTRHSGIQNLLGLVRAVIAMHPST